MSHWAEQYIGKPYLSGGRGPYAFDCWGLFWWINKHHFGVHLPEFPGVDSEDHLEVARQMHREELKKASNWAEWTQIDTPEDCCAVMMGGAEIFGHVGVYLALPDCGRILHARPEIGVVAQRPTEIQAQQKFHRLKYFKNVNLCHNAKPSKAF